MNADGLRLGAERNGSGVAPVPRKVLLAYPMTRADRPEWLRVQEIQREFASVVDGYHRMGFEVSDEAKGFNLAAARNEAIRYATSHNYDWLLLLDLDAVLVDTITRWPETGLGHVKILRAREDETPRQALAGAQKWEESNWFVLRRDVFIRFRFCEEFVGYGYEDFDFRDNVLGKAGVKMSYCDALALHVFHGPRPGWDYSRQEANRALYLKRRESQSLLTSAPTRMES